jgi:subtilisin family serine protease
MFRLSALLFAVVCFFPWACLAQGPGEAELRGLLEHPKIQRRAEMLDKLRQGPERLRVIVGLQTPAATGPLEEMRAAPRRLALRADMANLRRPLLDKLPPGQVSRVKAFAYLPAFAAEVTPDGLQKLLASDRVTTIVPDRVVYPHTQPELALVDAFSVRSVYRGERTSVAVCDTGVNYNHDMLDDHYLGGYDFGDDDSDPVDEGGHGTPVAGIAVGEDGVNGDYVGGVAPDAGYYSLKITAGSSGSATFSAIISAWEWAVDHQNDDPSRPIMAVNTSFGTDQGFSEDCEDLYYDFWLLNKAAGQARAAGILVLASSGNSGYSDQIASPACLSNVTSVGAVNDGDSVASFSNTADILDILAPGVSIRTTTMGGGYKSFSGTSASCPFAAGVAVLLQSAHYNATGAYLSASVLESKIKEFGVPVIDTRPEPDIVKPRTDVGATDIDGDDMPSGWEVDNFGDILTDADEDTDGDELIELLEYQIGADPNDPDSDDDGMPDGWETDNNLDPLTDDAEGDPDGDGYTNLEEYSAGTDPQDDGSQPQTPQVPALGLFPAALAALFLLLLGAAASRRRN